MAGGSAQFLMAILWLQSYGAYVVLFQEEFGWSKSALSTAFAVSQVSIGLLAPVQGWLIDKLGSRILMCIGMTMFGTGLILLSQIHSLIAFYVALGFISLGISTGGFVTIMAAVVNWFDRHRAKALSMTQVGFSVGGLCVPAMIFALELFGWRTTAVVAGVFILIIGIPLAMIFQHHPGPNDQIDGTLPRLRMRTKRKPTKIVAQTAQAVITQPTKKQPTDFSARQAMYSSAFWFISIGHGSSLLAVSAIAVHLIPYLNENLDYSLAQAGATVTLMTICQLGGQLSGSVISNYFSKRLICTMCMIGHALALLLLGFADSLPAVIIVAMLHGLSWGIRGPLMVAMRADYFGASSFGSIMGISSVIVMGGMAIGPVVVGVLADLYGSYGLGFGVLSGLVATGSIFFWLAKPPVKPMQHRIVA